MARSESGGRFQPGSGHWRPGANVRTRPFFMSSRPSSNNDKTGEQSELLMLLAGPPVAREEAGSQLLRERLPLLIVTPGANNPDRIREVVAVSLLSAALRRTQPFRQSHMPSFMEKKITKVAEVTKSIVAHLDSLARSVTVVSLSSLKETIAFSGSNETFREARRRTLIERPRWKLSWQSLVRARRRTKAD